jgi:tryptophan synthase alpha chain
MISISEAFERCRTRKRKALIPFLTAGFPEEGLSLRLLREFIKAGADLFEIGIPFSDPVADGKSIQYSSQRALEGGMNIEKAFGLITAVKGAGQVPPIVMSYFNPILSFGVRRFVRKAREVGVRGLIIPDMIPEEGELVEMACRENEIDLVYLVAPTSGHSRRHTIVNRSRGFVYLVSVTGVTGGLRDIQSRAGPVCLEGR